jgi:hypothetical protein
MTKISVGKLYFSKQVNYFLYPTKEEVLLDEVSGFEIDALGSNYIEDMAIYWYKGNECKAKIVYAESPMLVLAPVIIHNSKFNRQTQLLLLNILTGINVGWIVCDKHHGLKSINEKL